MNKGGRPRKIPLQTNISEQGKLSSIFKKRAVPEVEVAVEEECNKAARVEGVEVGKGKTTATVDDDANFRCAEGEEDGDARIEDVPVTSL